MAIKECSSIAKAVARTDALFVKAGGGSNDKESRYAVNVAVKVLEGFGAIQVDGDSIK